MLRNKNKRLTVQGRTDLATCNIEIKEIYNKYREKGYSMEEVFYMISSAAHQWLLNEAFGGNKK